MAVVGGGSDMGSGSVDGPLAGGGVASESRPDQARETNAEIEETDRHKKKPMNNGRADEALPRLTVEQKENPHRGRREMSSGCC